MSLTKDSETLMTAPSAAGTPAAAKPTAVEIPVSVNGARALAGSDKREPFSETTQTVLVFGHGAIIRLTSHVAPGQLLFLTNEKSKREVVCQVVRSKHSGAGSDYVELKFTEAAPEFWGIRFAAVSSAKPAAPAPTSSLEQKLAELAAAPAAASGPSPAKPAEAKPSAPEPRPAARVEAEPPAGADPAQAKLPTLSEFLAHGSSGPELKAPEKNKPEPSAPPKSAPADKPGAPSLSSVLLAKSEPAPGASSFDFAVDEVKIPSWLEPLARNAAVVVPAETETALDFDSLPVLAAPAAELEGKPAEEPAPERHQPALSSEGHAPNFGSSLAIDARAHSGESAGGFRIGWKLALLVAGLLLAAAVGWYWYSMQPAKVSHRPTTSSSNI